MSLLIKYIQRSEFNYCLNNQNYNVSTIQVRNTSDKNRIQKNTVSIRKAMMLTYVESDTKNIATSFIKIHQMTTQALRE